MSLSAAEISASILIDSSSMCRSPTNGNMTVAGGQVTTSGSVVKRACLSVVARDRALQASY